MSPEDLRLLESVGAEAKFEAGQVLIEHGQHAAGLYVILEGSVIVEAPEGTHELGAGSCVGERALLSDDGKRTARVQAVTEARVLAVERAQFEQLCAADPAFEQRFAEYGR
jgi:CRP-like cAMP-binding protein